MTLLTIPSALVAPKADKPLTPAMVSALWEVAAALDKHPVSATSDDPIWLEIPSKRLRGEGSRNDNIWLRECLNRLMGIKLSGEFRGDPWGAVVVAEWHITNNGSQTRILIPPKAIHALKAPSTFAKIEATAAHRLSGHARRLYTILADKKRLNKPTWTFDLPDLRSLLDVADKPTYDRWQDFKKRVLDPALNGINDYGTVTVKMTPVKMGKAVQSVRFDWKWKSIDEARETETENERHSTARRQDPEQNKDAPPLIAAASRPPKEQRQREAQEAIRMVTAIGRPMRR